MSYDKYFENKVNEILFKEPNLIPVRIVSIKAETREQTAQNKLLPQASIDQMVESELYYNIEFNKDFYVFYELT